MIGYLLGYQVHERLMLGLSIQSGKAPDVQMAIDLCWLVLIFGLVVLLSLAVRGVILARRENR